jgi:hypothetical protein
MGALIDKLFTPSESKAIKKLWEDKSARLLIQKEIGKQLLSKDTVVLDLPLSQIIFLTSLSSFASSERECYDVAEVVYWGINHNDILPMITQHRDKDLAYRCLISLGFFKSYIGERCKRYGSPSPEFYREVGIQSFHNIGEDDICEHFYRWECFLSEFFS